MKQHAFPNAVYMIKCLKYLQKVLFYYMQIFLTIWYNLLYSLVYRYSLPLFCVLSPVTSHFLSGS